MSKPIEITDSNYSEVLSSEHPVLVDFWAEWCAPCRALTPLVEGLATDYEGRLQVAKMNIDENPQTPTTISLAGGDRLEVSLDLAPLVREKPTAPPVAAPAVSPKSL